MKEWNKKIAVLQEQGQDEKKLINTKKESNKLKDLTYLKSQVPLGPFTTADEVHSYIRLPLEENEKNKRLYVEVRYGRVSSSTLKETASIFRLKRNGRNLTTQEYADNLIKYMDDTESMNTLTLADLNTAFAQMAGNDGNCETEEPCEDEVILNTISSSHFLLSFLPYFQKELLCTSLFHIFTFINIVQEKYGLIFQNVIITVIIFVVNSAVGFVSALLTMAMIFSSFFSSIKKSVYFNSFIFIVCGKH